MMRASLAAVLISAIALTPGSALAKPKAKAVGGLSLADARGCLGTDNSTAEEQVALCTKVLNSGKVLHPYEADYLAARSGAYNQIGEPEKALADINKALAIAKSPMFYFQRGIINMARSDIAAAKADFDEVIRMTPDYAAAHQMRGLASFQAGEYEDALKFFDGAVKRDATFYQALYARGVAKKKTGDESSGEQDIRAARGMSSSVAQDLAAFGVTP